MAARRGFACAAFAFALLVASAAALARAEPTLHARIDHFARTYTLHADLSYDETIEVDSTLLTARGIHLRERSSFSFYPASQSLDVVEAWVDQPDGERIDVPESARFTRPSEAAQNAPGFSGAQTTTLLFPQLRPGSRTHVRWHLIQKVAPLNGFNVWAEPPVDVPVRTGQVTILAPEGVPLHWAARGGFEVIESGDAGQRVVTATIRATQAQETERDSVASADFQPLFLATSLARLEDIGETYYRQSRDKAVVTPEIAELAARLAGGQDGEAAARRVYNWVTANIRYVAVYMDSNDGWVPHAADEVLRAGYGDCKDHVVLMQALLGALGIRAEAAVVDWGGRTRDAPLWLPQFNHAILYLPDFDRYLNPTNPYARYGSPDPRLAGKLVVRATPLGGVVGRTPPLRPEENVYRIDSSIAVAADGTLDGAARFELAPSMDSGVRYDIAQAASPEGFATRLLAATPEGGFGAFHAGDPRDLGRPLDLVATWRSPRAVAFQAGTGFLTVPVGPDLEPVERLRRYLTATGTRRHAVLACAGIAERVTHITLAPPLVASTLPPDVSIANAAGSYEATYTRVGDELRITRRLVLAHDVYPAADAPAFEALLYATLADARAVIVIERSQTVAATPKADVATP